MIDHIFSSLILLTFLASSKIYSQHTSISVSDNLLCNTDSNIFYTRNVTISAFKKGLVWIDNNGSSSLNDAEKFRRFFFGRRGDFTLAELINDQLLNSMTIEVGVSWFRYLDCTENLTLVFVSGIKIEEEQIMNWISEYFVFVDNSSYSGFSTLIPSLSKSVSDENTLVVKLPPPND